MVIPTRDPAKGGAVTDPLVQLLTGTGTTTAPTTQATVSAASSSNAIAVATRSAGQVAADNKKVASASGKGTTYLLAGGGALGDAAVKAESVAKRVIGPRRYNAMLHQFSRPKQTNAGLFEGHTNNGAGPQVFSPGVIYAEYTQSDLSSGDTASWYNRKTNWAFRFLYNPSVMQVTTNIDGQATPTAMDAAHFFGQQQAISFQLFLNRSEELARNIAHVDAPVIMKKGTQYDVEHLYKVINGDAGDVGFLVNTLVRVVFGPNNSYAGFITQIDAQHTMFNTRMVPMMTTVNINLQRVSQNANPAGVAATDAATS